MLVLVFLLFMSIIPLVLSLDTKINMQGDPGRVVTVKLLNEDTGKILDTGDYGDLTFGQDGKVSLLYSSSVQNKIKISLIMRPQMQTYQVFDDVKTGWIYNIAMNNGLPSIEKKGKVAEENGTIATTPTVPVETNTTLTNTTPTLDPGKPITDTTPIAPTTETSNSKESSGITGAVIGSLSNKSTYIYLGIALVILVGIILSFSFVRSANKDTYLNFRYKKNKGNYRDEEDDGMEDDNKLTDAERKIKEASDEIREIRQRRENTFRNPNKDNNNNFRNPNQNNNQNSNNLGQDKPERRFDDNAKFSG